MSEENNNLIKYCIHCGQALEKDRVYCPKCGKLAVKINSSESEDTYIKPIRTKKTVDIPERKCPDCGSLIKSVLLNQCPICNAKLEELPKEKVENLEKHSGFLFTEKKLIPEKELILKKDSWNYKEGMGVFANSILLFITASLLIIIYSSSANEGQPPTQDIYSILLISLPKILLGIFPIWYIYSKNHQPKKLSLDFTKKKFIIAIVIGILGGIGLYFIDIFSSFLVNIFADLGLEKIIPIKEDLNTSVTILRNSEIYWIVLFLGLLILNSITIEILFRGVLHNTLKVKYGNGIKNRIIIIFIVALMYTGIFSLLNYRVAIYFIPFYLMLNLLVGIIFELSESLYCTIIAQILLNILSLVIILF